ncbi:LuxR family transcriptional regulator [Sphaerisporangium flaviroseum]|uniref:LuxR family transcriptional regulator n=1 Tax=Sphaerisporangium flaviroseum TaxID=509199 RepID=A0ABP7JDI6_9ACTN
MTRLSADRMVGRATELELLRDAFGQAAGGSPQAVVVGGEAGVGKSRLVSDFAARATSDGARVLMGGCLDLSAGDMPYAPLAEVLRGLMRDLGVAAVRELAGRGWPELGRLVPSLLDEDQTEPPARDGSQARLFEAILRLLDRLSAPSPVLLVVENLQWADRSTLDLLVFLVRTLTRERVLVVCTYRTTDLRPGGPLRAVLAGLELSGRCRRCELGRLDLPELRELVAAILGTAPPAGLAERVHARSDGNPFFAEELLAAREPDDGDVPLAVRDIVLARVEALGDAAREVLGAAATAGRQVGHPLIAAVCDMGERELLHALRECVGRQVLVVNPVEQTYAFRHSLARDAVYAELLPGERILLHRAIATALAERPSLSRVDGPSAAAELAHHWEQAGDLPRALGASVRAAEAAISVFAYVEAGRQYDRALRLWEDAGDPEQAAGLPYADLLARAADACRWTGRLAEAVTLVDQALVHAEAEGDAVRIGALLERRGRYLWELGDGDASLRAYDRACEVLAAEPPSARLAWVLAGHATALMQAGRYRAAIARSEQALRTARQVGARAEEGRALNTMGVALTLTGAPDAGISAVREAARIADDTGALEDVFRAYANLAFVLETAGRLEEALEVAQRGVGRSRDLGLELTGGGVLLANAASVLVLLGRWDEAEEVADAARGRDMPPGYGFYLDIVHAEIEIGRGRLSQAERRLETAGSVATRLDEPQFAAPLHMLRAELALWRGRPGQARTAVGAGLAATARGDHGGFALRLCALGLRACADEMRRLCSLPRPDPVSLAELTTSAADLLRRAEEAATQPGDGVAPLPDMAATLALCRAEHDRLSGRQTAGTWAAVAASWSGLRRPYPAAYALWRQGEAAIEKGERQAAGGTFREAGRIAARLGAEPLSREITAMARAARVDIGSPPDPPPAPEPDPFGLTPREREVLLLLGQGWTNRQIARRLFITEKTASVHVSNILTKLGASSRGEAAVTARRLGIITT